jgi:hypothetical protein
MSRSVANDDRQPQITPSATPASGNEANSPPASSAPGLSVPAGTPPLFSASRPQQHTPHDERADYRMHGEVRLQAGRRRGCLIL